MVIGMLWYGPLFGKKWMKLSGMSHEKMQAAKKKGMGKTYLVAFIGSLVTAYVLSHFIAVLSLDATSASKLAVLVWLGFIATKMLSGVLWKGESVALYVLGAAEELVAIVAMALVLASWQ